ncbi:hypothetical protein D8Y20_07125 [Mariprofundus sp. EBB-1]|uniref:enoyl ACP reductase FabMG family protein n=1 Tax=Mariprofundus sp. EBB-1 TaxID=2650971 RepID=UPI000EF2021E|nr:hypothetical protein [Mariprofundus sp. EBB-1]RLL52280.1 hypothetical protein D8Y20_07125 [Mariprofundus sp. EBB-1]
MTELNPLREIPTQNIFKKGDVFVLFGELFGRGYVNGLIDQARDAGMTIVGITVGRRDEHNKLRSLTDEELSIAEDNLGGRIINIPMMAGFDLDAAEGEATPTDLLSSMTIKTWQDEKLDWAHIEACHEVGVKRFKDSLAQVVAQLEGIIPDGANAYFAHTMAGGIPKVKVFLAIANRIYKGRGARFMSSRTLLDSDLGKFILKNFDEVSANTFQYLIEATDALRNRLENSGGKVCYSAYGYHGTEILINDAYQWQSYSNYTQGYAKMRLESIAEAAWERGIKATVFNCPEIRTNSSDIFAGVELSLFPLLISLKRENGGQWAESQWERCRELLAEGHSLEELLQTIEDYNANGVITEFRNYQSWPMDNNEALAEVMVGTSGNITALHKDNKALITEHLSGLVLEGTGPLMFHEMSAPSAPVLWLNHDIIAKTLNAMHSAD